ncbi:MAG: hypothetical protein ACYC6C_11150 [Coriobacteriia bacterium]
MGITRPYQVTSLGTDGLPEVEVQGTTYRLNPMSHEVQVGDWVLTHGENVITVIPEADALAMLRSADEAERHEDMRSLSVMLSRVLPDGISAHCDGEPAMLYYVRIVREGDEERFFVDTQDDTWVSELLAVRYDDEALRDVAMSHLRSAGWVE